MNTIEQVNENVCVEFTASPLGLFGRSLLMGIGSVLVIPAPWLAAWFYRWCVDKVSLSDNTQVSFIGEGSQIWFPMMFVMGLSLMVQFAGKFFGQYEPFLPLLIMPVTCYLWLIIIRWFWSNVVSSFGTKVSFVGTYLPFLVWQLLFMLSFFTIVGWAWVTVGMFRWICRNIKGNNHLVEFHGNGWNVLWRSVVFILSCIAIIPIPWTGMWLIKWYMSNIVIKKA